MPLVLSDCYNINNTENLLGAYHAVPSNISIGHVHTVHNQTAQHSVTKFILPWCIPSTVFLILSQLSSHQHSFPLTHTAFLTLTGRLHTNTAFLTLTGLLHTNTAFLTLTGRLHTNTVFLTLTGRLHANTAFLTLTGRLHANTAFLIHSHSHTNTTFLTLHSLPHTHTAFITLTHFLILAQLSSL